VCWLGQSHAAAGRFNPAEQHLYGTIGLNSNKWLLGDVGIYEPSLSSVLVCGLRWVSVAVTWGLAAKQWAPPV
jgi:hypothetical protein